MWRNYDAWGNSLEPAHPIPHNEKKMRPAPTKRSYGWEEIRFPDLERQKAFQVYEALKTLGIDPETYHAAGRGEQKKMRRNAIRNKNGRGKKNAQAAAANNILIANGYPLHDIEIDAHMETEFYELSSDED